LEELTVRALLEAGIHYGHRTSRWNPKMKPYIYGRRKMIHIVDIRETLRGLVTATKFLEKLVAQGRDVVFVGTKRQARAAVRAAAQKTGMHFVTERWIGGTLTNFHVIRSRVSRLEELEQLESSGEIDRFSKKEGATLRRELRKIKRNLDGIRRMKRLPGALVVVDPHRERIAVREANHMGIPTLALADTNCDPDPLDILIPGNDDAMRAIQMVLGRLSDAVVAGLARRDLVAPMPTATPTESVPAETRRDASPAAEATGAGAVGRTPQPVRPRRRTGGRGRGPRRGAATSPRRSEGTAPAPPPAATDSAEAASPEPSAEAPPETGGTPKEQ